MKWFLRSGIVLGASALFVVVLAGCSGPQLSAQPGSLVLSEASPVRQFTISNEGSGTLNWTVSAPVPWLLFSLGTESGPEPSIAGSTVNNATARVHLNVDELPESDSDESIRGIISIKSNGGNREIQVAIERERTPALRVEPEALDFGETESELLVEVVNRGDALLQWQLTLPEGVDWLSVDKDSGSASRTSAQAIKVRVNRAALVPAAQPYTADIEITSNGGDVTIPVSVVAVAFVVRPGEIEFGPLAQLGTQVLIVETQSATPVLVTTTTQDTSAADWLTIAPSRFEVTRGSPVDVRVTADPTDRDIGAYGAEIILTHEASGRSVEVPVSFEVAAPPAFTISPENMAFGETRGVVSGVVTITNDGEGSFEWRIEKPRGATWLTLEPENGVLEDTVTVTVAADASGLPVREHSANLLLYAGGLSRVLRVSLDRVADPRPDALEVSPDELEFGDLLNTMNVSVWNEGPSRLEWSVTGALPAWLAMSRISGSVEGLQTQTVNFTLDRALLPDEDVTHTVRFNVNNPAVSPVDVVVKAQPSRFPDVEIIGEGVDNEGLPYLLIDIGQDTDIFFVRNQGNANLTWIIDPTQLPPWITSVSPLQGEVRPGREQQVQVTTNRLGLTQTGGLHRLWIETNDPLQRRVSIEVQVRVPFVIEIGVRPESLNFGRTRTALSFEVANTGDPGWPLDFVVTSNRPEWLFVEPDRGRSMGTSGPIKDWRLLSVAIDRGRIEGTGAAARILISAENVPANALPVSPVEITVSVDVADLTVETAFPRVRPPSLLRFGLLLRDARQLPFTALKDAGQIPGAMARLNTVRVSMLEDSEPIDLTETNVIVKKDETLSFLVLILLDYSASMLAAAQALVDDGQLNPGARNPLDALYVEAIGAMLEQFPEHYRVGIGVFNERRPWWHGDIRMITGAPGDYTGREAGTPFATDRSLQRYRLENMDVRDYGATPLYPAVSQAAWTLHGVDDKIPDFDAPAERVIVLVSDGQRTTPPGDLAVLLEELYATRARMFAVGWGNRVLANPLIQMASESGGHYYSTENRLIPGEFDQEGRPRTVPLKSSLLDRCRTLTDAPVVASVPLDLKSHVALSYVTLNEEEAFTVQGRVEVDVVNPSVKETFSLELIPAGLIANEVRMGQIGMRTQGIQPDGTATIQVYTDYMPRRISAMEFEVLNDQGFASTVVLASTEQGGLMADWTGPSATGVGRYSIGSPTNRPLMYGDYGRLFDIVVSDVTGPFTLFFNVLDPVRTQHSDSKFFIHPEYIEVTEDPSVAYSFPHPAFDFSPVVSAASIVDMNIIQPGENAYLYVTNVGGAHLWYTTFPNPHLYWSVRQTDGVLPGTFQGSFELAYLPVTRESDTAAVVPPLDPNFGDYYGVYWVDAARIVPGAFVVQEAQEGEDEPQVIAADPGLYSREFYIDVSYGSLPYAYTYGPYYLRYEVE